MRLNLLLLFLMVVPVLAFAQSKEQSSLYMPLEFQKAYENGTRSRDGKPGPNYWQNHARYDIRVRVDVPEQKLYGEEEVVYLNNSPDELKNLVVKMLYDLFRKGSSRDYPLSPEAITEGAEVEAILINGDTLDVEGPNARRSGTNWTLTLSEPLAAGDSLNLYIKWSEPIPSNMLRVGVSDSSSFFVGYWYPQIAVYDDVFGWDTYNYTGQAETYNGLADYDVRITVPESMYVQATGTLLNAAAVWPAEQLERYREARRSDETIVIVGEEDIEQGLRMKSNTWHYRATNVPDFTFFTSDHFLWDAASLDLGGRRVFISSIYPENTKGRYEKVTQLQRDIMRFFSTEVTGIPYPYPAYSSINADRGGGMEFPMLANNGAPGSREGMANLTAHEMHHMYFPFYVRINERRHAWMDEGWADYITDIALVRSIIGAEYEEQARQNMVSSLSGAVGSYSHLPLIVSTQNMNSENYGFSSYSLPHYVYEQLHKELGEEAFVRCLREYIRRWAYKSPTPYDFFFTFEDVSGRDLSWFWKQWFFEFGYPDLALGELDKKSVTVLKKGEKPLPVKVQITYEDGETETLTRPASAWSNGTKAITLKRERKGQPTRILLNPMELDANQLDNFYLSEVPAEAEVRELTGIYQVNNTIRIEVDPASGGAIMFRVLPFNFEFTLLPDGDGRYSGLSGSPEINFNRNSEGEIIGLLARAFGQMIPARKI
jgi:hypothetical protein